LKLIDRYIGGSVITGTFVVLAVLLTLMGFVALEDELGEVGKGSYTISDVLLYVLLVLPRSGYEVFPVAALLGGLSGLGFLARHSELIALRAAGVSLAQVVSGALKAGLILAVVSVLIGEFLAPASEQFAKRLRAERIHGHVTLHTKYGFWARDGSAFVNIREILPGAQLGDIYIYEYDENNRLRLATHAQQALYREDHWLLKGLEQSEFVDGMVRTRSLDEAAWTSFLDPGLLRLVMVDPLVLPLRALHKYISFMRENGQNADSYEVAFWTKIVNPLVILIMLFLSVLFVFGDLRTVGVGQRVFAGAVLGAGFLLLNKAFGHLAVVFHINPLLAACLPGALCLLLAIWYTRRI